MDSGIYMIYCTENNKPYIGKAENLDERKLQHFSHLKIGNHPCVEMQDDFNKYGEEAFRFSILERCDESKLDHLEDYYILSYNAISHGYNQKRGNVISLTEDSFSSENSQKNTWDIVLEKFDLGEENPLCKVLCLQMYIYELNQIYNQNKTYGNYLNYIIGDKTKFHILKNNLSGSEFIEVDKKNISKVYDKYIIYITRPIVTCDYYEYRSKNIKILYDDILEVMEDVLFNNMKVNDAVKENTLKILYTLELPSENLNNQDDVYEVNTLCELLFSLTSDKRVRNVLQLGLMTIESNIKLDINTVLNTNLLKEKDEF